MNFISKAYLPIYKMLFPVKLFVDLSASFDNPSRKNKTSKQVIISLKVKVKDKDFIDMLSKIWIVSNQQTNKRSNMYQYNRFTYIKMLKQNIKIDKKKKYKTLK